MNWRPNLRIHKPTPILAAVTLKRNAKFPSRVDLRPEQLMQKPAWICLVLSAQKHCRSKPKRSQGLLQHELAWFFPS